jgi:hypothetical protein
LDFLPKFEQFYAKLETYKKLREQQDEARKAFLQELQVMKNFVKNPPADAKKNLKTKTSDKVEALSTNLQAKLDSDQKKRHLAGERFRDLSTDMESLHLLLH